VPDPRDPERGLTTPDGSAVIYTCRIDLLAIDAADEYWVVRHRIVDDWQESDALIRDEPVVAACWAWEQEYLGMEISGTIHNEVRINGPLDLPDPDRTANGCVVPGWAKRAQRWWSSNPQHRRLLARTARTDDPTRVEQYTAGLLRRTHIRRSPRRNQSGSRVDRC